MAVIGPLTAAQVSERIEALLQANDFGRAQWPSATGPALQLSYRFEAGETADFPWT
jgi:hypothetical protein